MFGFVGVVADMARMTGSGDAAAGGEADDFSESTMDGDECGLPSLSSFHSAD